MRSHIRLVATPVDSDRTPIKQQDSTIAKIIVMLILYIAMGTFLLSSGFFALSKMTEKRG